MIKRPFNIQAWIRENQHLLQPPVGNKNLYVESGDYIVMMVGGPNARKDYHFNETEELFYQWKGDIVVGIQEEGKAVDIEIKEGEMFLLPAGVPHQPRRGPDTVGLVIEVKRADREMKDGLMWFARSVITNCMKIILYFEILKLISSLDSDISIPLKNSEHVHLAPM